MMASCKDCIHYDACESFAKSLKFATAKFLNKQINPKFPYENIECITFKPKSRFIELPCAVGDKVYWINRVAKKIESDIVIAIHQYEDGFSITTKTIGTKCTSTYSLNRFLEIMHFTKEEAEKALAERKNNG